jgi:hypothetical protein
MPCGPQNVFKFWFPWPKNMKSHIAKKKKFDGVRVWLYLAISKLDFNVLAIPTMHCSLDMPYHYDNGLFEKVNSLVAVRFDLILS